jgi:hypothetical protein
MLAMAGCTTTNDVLFVTKTSLGLDFDAKPASASIAYDRTEGYIAPRYDNGEIPPVVASIKSDAKIFNPKIKQVYATGDAAVIAVSQCPKVTLAALDPKNPPDTPKPPSTTNAANTTNNTNSANTERTENGCPELPSLTTSYVQKKLQGEKKAMFFGTSTTTGLKVGFTTYVPDSFVFGYKRKEYSFIPLGEQVVFKKDVNGQPVRDRDGNPVIEEKYDVYPSVLASIDTDANAGSADEEGVASGDTSLSNSQYFATGRAARELAANPDISEAFKVLAARSLQAEDIRRQDESNIDKIVKKVFDQENKFDKTKFGNLIDNSRMSLERKKNLMDKVKDETTVEELRTILNDSLYTDFLQAMANSTQK